MAGVKMLSFHKNREKISQLCQKYLLEIIEETFKGKYKIILKEDYKSSILYTEVAIEDITDILRQELLKRLPRHTGRGHKS